MLYAGGRSLGMPAADEEAIVCCGILVENISQVMKKEQEGRKTKVRLSFTAWWFPFHLCFRACRQWMTLTDATERGESFSHSSIAEHRLETRGRVRLRSIYRVQRHYSNRPSNKTRLSHSTAVMSLKRKAADIVAAEAKKPKANSSITSFFGPPKTVSTSSTNPSKDSTDPAPAPAVKFDKEKWVAGLSEEQRALLKLEIETLDESWLAVLKEEITTKSFLDLKKFLKSEAEAGKKIFPPSQDVYSWYV